MKLQDWMGKHKVTPAEFAKMLGVGYSTVYRYLEGTRLPSGRRVARIRALTSSEVTADDLFPAEIRKPKRGHKAA